MNCDALLGWMDQHQSFYFCLVAGLITAALVRAIVPLVSDQPAVNLNREHDWRWGVLIVAILAVGRWPSIFFPREFNPDESQLLAGAHALFHDPVFWRSVDGGTAGPLDFFALWPAGWLFGWQTYLAARFTAFVLLSITLVLAHQCMALVLGRMVARVVILTAVCLEALTLTVDLLHYSTEVLPVALLTAAAYSAIRRWVHQGGPIWNGLGGLLLGAVPWAKLQAVPLAACLGVGWLLTEVFSKEPRYIRRQTYLLAGAFFPAILVACQLTLTGEWRNFTIPYFFCNIQYSQDRSSSLQRLLSDMLDFSIQQDSLIHLWLPGIVIWLVLMLRIRRIGNRTARVFTLASFGAFLLALLSVIYPGNPALHYWQLAVVPGTFILGAMVENLLSTSPKPWQKRERWLVAICALGLVGSLLVHRAWVPNHFMGFRAFFQQNPHNKLVGLILTHVRRDDSIAVWGWSNYVYVETGLLQATRDAGFARSIEAGPYRRFYRERFLADLAKARPTFFLDSVGPCTTVYQDLEYAHDQNFPELAAMIRANYDLVDEVLAARLYRRRDSADH